MQNTLKSDIIARLQQEIMPLQGLRPIQKNVALNAVLGPLRFAFPNACFPLGAVHEFVSNRIENTAATNGFISGLLAPLMGSSGIVIWVSTARTIFPPALSAFGVVPDKVIFIDLKTEKEMLWVAEEALKCKGLTVVVAEMTNLSFTVSRRFQLAVEDSNVTGFMLRRDARKLETNACISRWQITSLPSQSIGGLPGVGLPRWKVELLRTRNGKTGCWEIEWAAGQYRHIQDAVKPVWEPQKAVS